MTICTPWRVANALEQLLAQVNAFAPHRNKASDGGIGDAAHQAEACSSQHNSCCIKVGGIWIVRARDFTHDPAGGFDSYAFAEQLRLSHDSRIRYVISNRRITSGSRNWQWESYDGSDPHTNHAHVSTWDDQTRFDDTSRAWRISSPVVSSSTPISMERVNMFLVRFKNASGAVDPMLGITDGRTGLQDMGTLFGPVAQATHDAFKAQGVPEWTFNTRADADTFANMFKGAPAQVTLTAEQFADFKAGIVPIVHDAAQTGAADGIDGATISKAAI